MIVYVETNFVLEMAFVQEQHDDCEAILGLCEAGRVALVVPAFCFAEPYETLERRRRERRRLLDDLSRELNQLARTQLYEERTGAMDEVTSLLAKSAEEKKDRLDAVIHRLLALAETIPLDGETLRSASKCQRQYDLSPQDAIVYTSLISHVARLKPESSCFLTKNAKDFNNPDIVAALEAHHGKLLFNFEAGLGYVHSCLKAGGDA
jgi:predicted nucleic acid-binding protein